MLHDLPPDQKLQFKYKLKQHGIAMLMQRLETALLAMQNAQDSANNDNKSTVGDKHETTRAMGHLDNEMNARQMEEAQHELAFLNSITVSEIYMQATIGAVVVCRHAMFFIASGIGTQQVAKEKIIFISPKAPLSMQLLTKRKGERFTFNGVDFIIEEVF